MSSIAISSIVFACVFGGAMLGMLRPRRVAPASSECRVERRREARDGAGRDHVGFCSRFAGRFGQGFVRRTEQRADRDVRQGRPAGPRPGSLWAGDEGNARSTARFRCPHSRSDVVERPCKPFPIGGALRRRRKFSSTKFRSSRRRRQATLAASPGDEYRVGSRTNALVAICAGLQFDFHAVAGRAGLLAYHLSSSASASLPLPMAPCSPACLSPRCPFPPRSC